MFWNVMNVQQEELLRFYGEKIKKSEQEMKDLKKRKEKSISNLKLKSKGKRYEEHKQKELEGLPGLIEERKIKPKKNEFTSIEETDTSQLENSTNLIIKNTMAGELTTENTCLPPSPPQKGKLVPRHIQIEGRKAANKPGCCKKEWIRYFTLSVKKHSLCFLCFLCLGSPGK